MGASDAATVTASTKRPPAVSGGKVAAPAANLTSINIVPLLPVTPETVGTVQLQSPREARETYVFPSSGNTLPDIDEGDVLVVASVEYVVRSVAEYQRADAGSYLHVIVEEQK